MNLAPVIQWLENGCDPKEAAKELRIYHEMQGAIDAGDGSLMDEQAALLSQCRAALDSLLRKKPMLAVMEYECGALRDTLGNLRAKLYEHQPRGVFGVPPGHPVRQRKKD